MSLSDAIYRIVIYRRSIKKIRQLDEADIILNVVDFMTLADRKRKICDPITSVS